MILQKSAWLIHSLLIIVHSYGNYHTLVFKLIQAHTCVISFLPKLSLQRDTFTPTVQKRKSKCWEVKWFAQGGKLYNNRDITLNPFSWLQIHAFPTRGHVPNPLVVTEYQESTRKSLLDRNKVQIPSWGFQTLSGNEDKQRNLPAFLRWYNMFQTFISRL